MLMDCLSRSLIHTYIQMEHDAMMRRSHAHYAQIRRVLAIFSFVLQGLPIFCPLMCSDIGRADLSCFFFLVPGSAPFAI